jgi:hypothetical protein
LPAQSRMPVPTAAEDAFGKLAAHSDSLYAAAGGNLLDCFTAVPDPRDPRGIRHSLASVLAMCTAAALCGCTSLQDVTAWAAAAPQEVLAAAGCRRSTLGSACRCTRTPSCGSSPCWARRTWRITREPSWAAAPRPARHPPGRRAGLAAGNRRGRQARPGRGRPGRADPVPAGRRHPRHLRGDRRASHPRNVFTKLGIQSRRGLANALAGPDSQLALG